ncbi:phage/plasmid primase, P4 family [Bradyrhizobium erythrophlei]|uniref:DNA primase family protein n=1 Tax=Bradyrhizobium erythrophlei TaxID=1437360 RepID=UPI0035ED26BD
MSDEVAKGLVARFQRRVGAAAPKLIEPEAAKPAPQPEPEPPKAEPPPSAAPGEAQILVDVGAPYEVARRFLLSRYSIGSVPTLRCWHGDWRKWTGTHYAEMEDAALRTELYDFLATINGGKFDPKPKHVNELIDAIKARVLLNEEIEVGTWLGDDAAPWGDGAFICCRNGVVRLSDGKLWPHDPKLFVLNAIETEYLPEAQATRWQSFLDELWTDDEVTRDALQEFFGLVLTDETRFQKGFILVGPARSGKGTIARVLRNLLGSKNYCGPSLNQMAREFGLQSFIGKKLAVVPDARLDNRANRSVITEKLLSIIGEDPQDINRKNKDFWSGVLRTRIMILSNELPDFKDDTGVIATRFIILQTQVSFLGREDPGLEDKLSAELSGILNWAIAGWQRLASRGKFKPPGNGELNDELAGMASSIKAFVAERCELGADYSAAVDTIYSSYREWCQSNGGGWSDRLPINQFSGKLRSAFHGQIETIRPRTGNEGRKRMFAGIRIRQLRVLK